MTKINKAEIRIIYADTDQMGIVYHANYLKFFEIGRTELLRELGMPYKVCEEKGIMLPVKEVFIDYKRSAKYDDVIIVSSYVATLKNVSLKINYEIYEKQSQKLLTLGYTVHPFVDKDGKVVRPPEDIFQLIKQGK